MTVRKLAAGEVRLQAQGFDLGDDIFDKFFAGLG